MDRFSQTCRQGAVIEKLKQLNFGGTQIDDGHLQLGLILHALQLNALKVNPCNITILEANLADVDDLVVVLQVGFGELKNGSSL